MYQSIATIIFFIIDYRLFLHSRIEDYLTSSFPLNGRKGRKKLRLYNTYYFNRLQRFSIYNISPFSLPWFVTYHNI